MDSEEHTLASNTTRRLRLIVTAALVACVGVALGAATVGGALPGGVHVKRWGPL
jgi:hypothetical protein